MTVQGLGASLSPAIGGWIAQEIGYGPMFLILGGFALGSIALWVGFARSCGRPARGRARTSRRIPVPAGALAAGARAMTDVGVNAATWGIAGLATFGVIARPWNLPEFIWAVAGAALLVLFNLLPWPDALAAAAKGTDVYLFLIGMMLLAEVARKEGLFDWLAAQAVRTRRGLGEAAVPDRLRRRHRRDGVSVERRDGGGADAGGLCRDARRKGRAAALSVHLRVHRQRGELRAADLQPGQSGRVRQRRCRRCWNGCAIFALPSALRSSRPMSCCGWTQRRALDAASLSVDDIPPLTLGGKLAAAGIALTAVVLLGASALGAISACRRSSPVSRRDRSCWRSAAVAAAGTEGRVVVGAAAGRRLVHSGRGPQPDRRAAVRWRES